MSLFPSLTELGPTSSGLKYRFMKFSSGSEPLSVTQSAVAVISVSGEVRFQLAGGPGGQIPVGEGGLFKNGVRLQWCESNEGGEVLLAMGASAKLCASSSSQLPESILPLSSYRVQKPWGSERWYTEGTDLPFALKLISMRAGERSSLQSHRFKTETLFLLNGKAEIDFGVMAPADLLSPIDERMLSHEIRLKGESWSNLPGEIHRLWAKEDLSCVEISTLELDDVIRWKDDSSRLHGRIESEHVQGCEDGVH